MNQRPLTEEQQDAFYHRFRHLLELDRSFKTAKRLSGGCILYRLERFKEEGPFQQSRSLRTILFNRLRMN